MLNLNPSTSLYLPPLLNSRHYFFHLDLGNCPLMFLASIFAPLFNLFYTESRGFVLKCKSDSAFPAQNLLRDKSYTKNRVHIPYLEASILSGSAYLSNSRMNHDHLHSPRSKHTSLFFFFQELSGFRNLVNPLS